MTGLPPDSKGEPVRSDAFKSEPVMGKDQGRCPSPGQGTVPVARPCGLRPPLLP